MAGTSENGGGNDDALAAYTSPRAESIPREDQGELPSSAYLWAAASFALVVPIGGAGVGAWSLTLVSAYFQETLVLSAGWVAFAVVGGTVGGLMLGMISYRQSLRVSRKALEKGRRESR